MAKRGHKHQRAHRVRGENAGTVVYGLPLPPEQLSQLIDGRHRTRKIGGKRKEDVGKGGKRAAIARTIKEHQ